MTKTEESKKSTKSKPKKETKTKKLEIKISELEELVFKAQDEKLRSLAELENFKKRKEQELLEFKKYANDKIVVALFPVLDSFDMALSQAQVTDSPELKNAIIGFEYIHKQISDVLEKNGVKKITPKIGDKFNPNEHQAMSKQKSEDFESDIICQVMQSGYSLNDRLSRPAMVIVAE